MADARKQARIGLDNAKAQQTVLSGYYSDYAGRFERQQTAQRPQDIMTQRAFLGQMAEAIKAQDIVVEQAQTQYDESHATYLKAYLKRQNLETLIEKYRLQERAEEARREQQISDEWVTQVCSQNRRD